MYHFLRSYHTIPQLLTNTAQGYWGTTSSPALVFGFCRCFVLNVITILMGIKWYFAVGFICISLVIGDVEHISGAYWAFLLWIIAYSSTLSILLLSRLCCELQSSWNILYFRIFIRFKISNISPSPWEPFHSDAVSFDALKGFSFDEVQLIYFFSLLPMNKDILELGVAGSLQWVRTWSYTRHLLSSWMHQKFTRNPWALLTDGPRGGRARGGQRCAGA
jgi:hypothetical protein